MSYEAAPIPDDRDHVLLFKIARGIAAVANAFGVGVVPGLPTPITVGPAQASTSASGAVAAGKRSISFVTSSDWVGTINGASFPAGAAKSYTAPPGYSLASIAYTRSAGTLYIDSIG